jgi:hypothetical protein
MKGWFRGIKRYFNKNKIKTLFILLIKETGMPGVCSFKAQNWAKEVIK